MIFHFCKNIVLFLILFAFAFFVQSGLLNGQRHSIVISGTVSEAKSGEVLIGANAVLYKDSLRTGAPVAGTATNKYGFFSLPAVKTGRYFLFITSIGYDNDVRAILVSDTSHNLRLTVLMQKRAIRLREVVVEDRRKTDFSNTAGTIQIEPLMVQQLPSMGGETDIFRALQLLPGVSSATELSTGLYVRGGSADQNLTLIDGVPVYNPSHLGGFSSTFNGDAIQNMKLIKGAFPAEYGNRLSSVLDVIMRRGGEDKVSGTAGLNLISSRVTIEGPLEKKSTFILSGRKMFLDKILPMLKNESQIPKYSFYDFNGKINYNINENERLFISGFTSSDKLSEPSGAYDVGFDINWSNATLNLTWSRISSETAFTNTSLMYTNYAFSTLLKDKIVIGEPQDFFTSSIINDISFKRETQTFFGEEHTFKFGFEAVYHHFNTTTSDFFVKELKYRPNYGKQVQAYDLGIYFQDDWQITQGLKMNGGLRGVYQNNARFIGVEPRLTLTYYFLDRFILRSGFAIANQTLHLLARNDVYLPTDVWYPASRSIVPSRSIQSSLGFEATSFERTFLFSFDVYYKDMKHLYEYDDNADFGLNTEFERQLTEGRGDAYGFELFLNKRIGDFTGWVGYTLAWTKRYFEKLNKGLSFYPRFDRRHDVSIVLTYQPWENLSLGATWTYGTGQAYSLPVGQYGYQSIANPLPAQQNTYIEYSNRDGYRLPDFHKLDLSARYTFDWAKRPFEISLNVYNAYNRYNVFSKYIGYKQDVLTGKQMRVLKQFTLFPFLPTIGVKYSF